MDLVSYLKRNFCLEIMTYFSIYNDRCVQGVPFEIEYSWRAYDKNKRRV